MERDEYKKCHEDELDWSSIEQLHEATLQISNQCFEYKKLCVGVIGIIIAALLKFETSTSWSSISNICAAINFGFWLCDANAYYYQRANRQKINKLVDQIRTRNSNKQEHVSKLENSWASAFFNRSMSLYFYALTLCFGAVLYEKIA
ncbi:hypothetical protein [Pseudomonas sp. Sample_23]|uniref:hypothetical protein n=1 Tax=Pseudomonas sp. Sample_23 TaxID=2448267 RepID=UPI0010329592|nr:hypothetical protein [Pseudomonas sp. Sample_23]